MVLDWVSVLLGVMIVMIFMAIFSLLRLMNSPYIKRFEPLVNSKLEFLSKSSRDCKIVFQSSGRTCELWEVKYANQQNRQKVYDSCLLLKVKTSTQFTFHMDDVLNKIHVAEFMQNIPGQSLDYACQSIVSREVSDVFKDFKICTNDVDRAKEFLSHPEVVAVLTAMKAQYSVYGFLMPVVVNKGEVIIDYTISQRLLNDIIFDSKKLMEHVQALNLLADHVESIFHS